MSPDLKLMVASPQRYSSRYRAGDPALGWLQGPDTELQFGNWPYWRNLVGSRESSGIDCTRNGPGRDGLQLRPGPKEKGGRVCWNNSSRGLRLGTGNPERGFKDLRERGAKFMPGIRYGTLRKNWGARGPGPGQAGRAGAS